MRYWVKLGEHDREHDASGDLIQVLRGPAVPPGIAFPDDLLLSPTPAPEPPHHPPPLFRSFDLPSETNDLSSQTIDLIPPLFRSPDLSNTNDLSSQTIDLFPPLFRSPDLSNTSDLPSQTIDLSKIGYLPFPSPSLLPSPSPFTFSPPSLPRPPLLQRPVRSQKSHETNQRSPETNQPRTSHERYPETSQRSLETNQSRTSHERYPETSQRPTETSQRSPETSQPKTSQRSPETSQRSPETSQPRTSQRSPEKSQRSPETNQRSPETSQPKTSQRSPERSQRSPEISQRSPEASQPRTSHERYPETTTGVEQTIEVEEIHIHPQHQPYLYNYHDLALLRLKEPAKLTKRVLPACLPHDTDDDYLGKDLTVVGWGFTTGLRELSRTLQKVKVPVVDRLRCGQIIGNPQANPWGITSDMMCAGEPDRDSCKGDSGGPLSDQVAGDDGSVCEHTVAGVVSFGVGMDSSPCGRLGVYIRVASYLDWITGYIAPRTILL
ncbi:hypothetical protein Pcinc_007037 [Petrolisthes cinctipes]|uniref:Peptidase S1 domain-containing protein n=1 Tax=Petrolisthes cinctipes TaxID=88211 RepID=A0AAE1KXC7_PETCI|nr:hypothetical protein Pcinc_007037 [Petrolisthes cinctipes]